MKRCTRCQKRPQRKSHRWCSECFATYMREWRKSNRLTGDARRRANARSYANVYLRRGKIQREPCVDCGGPGEHMHHENYDRPLDITWLCETCHGERHGADRAAA